LKAIESTLEVLHRELEEVIAGTAENKKQILLTEENLTKAMLKIDAIESDGDLSIRKHRKELIKRSQNMLDLVDEFKSRNKKSSTSSSEEEAVTAPIEIESTVEPESSFEPEAESDEPKAVESEATDATTESEDAEFAELESLSGIESLPEVQEVHVESASSDEPTESDKVQEDATPKASSEENQSGEESESDSESESSNALEQEQEPVDPLDLIVDAALDLTHPEILEHDFELVSVH
ncbi:hypothetical protein BGZ81_008162, partial [Podila clonocystis]